jgi:hypothetical protein
MREATARGTIQAHVALDDPGSVEARSARRAARGRPAATSDGDLKAFAGWPVLSQMFEAVGRCATGPWL